MLVSQLSNVVGEIPQRRGPGTMVGVYRRIFVATGYLACCIALLTACGSPKYVVLSGQTMGTYFAIKHPGTPGCQVPLQTFEDQLTQINRAMSTYQNDSEISRFNRARHTNQVDISDSFSEVMHASRQVYEETGGAFDVTVGPLVNLWGFGPEERPTAPDVQLQRAAAIRVGMDLLNVGEASSAKLQKIRADVEIDLSALAKGYAVDELAEILLEKGCTDFMVDIGGEMRLAGVNQSDSPWQIGVERPDADRIGVSQDVLALSNVAIATSGDYRNFRMVDGKRIDHVIDPRTGQPATSPIAAVTVVHSSAMLADAYATALMVLTPTEGIELADRLNFAVLIMYRTAVDQPAAPPSQRTDGVEVRYNAAMQQYFNAS